MLNKPFKVPFAAPSSAEQGSPPPPKRRRLSPEPDSGSQSQTQTDGANLMTRDAALAKMQSYLAQNRNPAVVSSQNVQLPKSGEEQRGEYYNILWRNPTAKKHKTWDGDGVISVANGTITMYDESGKPIGRTKHSRLLEAGTELSICGREVEIESSMTKDEFRAFKPLPTKASSRPASQSSSKPASKPATVRELDQQLRTDVKFNSDPAFLPDKGGKIVNKPFRPLTNFNTATSTFKSPMPGHSQPQRPSSKQAAQDEPVPRHNPLAEGAVVMQRPSEVPKGKRVVDVVIDPLVCKHLREHQKEGVKFMYECVMGMRPHGGLGAILADQMGLGKTLQVIALLWTLFKQNPIYEEAPIVRKAVVICPVSVIKNWKKEFRKWLGEGRLGILAFDEKRRLKDFTHGRAYQILIIGYEKFRSVQAELDQGTGVDIVICDEGHRLKTAKNKAAQGIKSLNTERRIVLSGTPLQNDLSELYFVSDLVNPGMLGKPAAFKKEFELPIARSAEPDASPSEVQKGQARGAELAEMTSMYILRRTMDLIAEYLPPKTETVIFCRATKAQADVYRKIISSPTFGAVLGSNETALQFINILKKVCNTPHLLRQKGQLEEAQKSPAIAELLERIPSNLMSLSGTSGKLSLLDNMLHHLSQMTDEKVVIVSHYTATLDLLGNLLSSLHLPFLRLDGQTPNSKRQGLVDAFNRSPATKHFAFLLSAKSGGAGINLIGASRLILFDVDWNPSTEDQAMARIHRDGQERHCRIYRFLVQGALDEKIYQRQLTKRALADSVVDGKQSATNFSREELKRLFAFDESPACQTHTLLECNCEGTGTDPLEQTAAADAKALADGAQTPNLSDSDDELPTLGELMSASQALKHEQRRASPTKNSRAAAAAGGAAPDADAQVQSLMAYRHLDPARVSGDELLGVLDADEVLAKVLADPDSRVGYIFSKTYAKPVAAPEAPE